MAPRYITARVEQTPAEPARTSQVQPPWRFPTWAGIAIVACALIFGLYFLASLCRAKAKRARHHSHPLFAMPLTSIDWQRLVARSAAEHKSPSNSDETLVNALGEIPSIAAPVPARTAGGDNTAQIALVQGSPADHFTAVRAQGA
ncbi:hypothetical protein B0H15DRAFT_800874 [Mycena belliarum]|uniref:Uncharacterized protein n=1 Tax=Mycena belliarum TaxID=1033014 RepID=A0AAD6XUG3_9AGAR|nr:hypothetical protein B0H15DRAFT_800874 [Mycena belliae]